MSIGSIGSTGSAVNFTQANEFDARHYQGQEYIDAVAKDETSAGKNPNEFFTKAAKKTISMGAVGFRGLAPVTAGSIGAYILSLTAVSAILGTATLGAGLAIGVFAGIAAGRSHFRSQQDKFNGVISAQLNTYLEKLNTASNKSGADREASLNNAIACVSLELNRCGKKATDVTGLALDLSKTNLSTREIKTVLANFPNARRLYIKEDSSKGNRVTSELAQHCLKRERRFGIFTRPKISKIVLSDASNISKRKVYTLYAHNISAMLDRVTCGIFGSAISTRLHQDVLANGPGYVEETEFSKQVNADPNVEDLIRELAEERNDAADDIRAAQLTGADKAEQIAKLTSEIAVVQDKISKLENMAQKRSIPSRLEKAREQKAHLEQRFSNLASDYTPVSTATVTQSTGEESSTAERLDKLAVLVAQLAANNHEPARADNPPTSVEEETPPTDTSWASYLGW